MPELPEVETVRRDLVGQIVGRGIVDVESTGGRTVRRHTSPSELTDAIVGAVVTDVRRLGKYLVLDATREARPSLGETSGPTAHLVIHLGMSGQLRWSDVRGSERARHTHVVVCFADGGELHFVDPRTFGEVFAGGAVSERTRSGVEAARRSATGVATGEGLGSSTGGGSGNRGWPTELDHVGVDALDALLTPEHLASLMSRTRSPIKAVLMNQRVVSGIGNIYSDEILFAAGVRHDRPASSLGSIEVQRVHQAIGTILSEAIDLRGSSLADLQYRDLRGRVGAYQEHHQVHARAGCPCPRCGRPIESAKAAGRTASFCRKCQK